MKQTPFEEWEETPKINLKRIFIVVLAIGLIVGSCYAFYKIVSPDSDQVTVTEPATLNKPTVNATSAVTGDTIQISTQLSDGAAGLEVYFYENDVLLSGFSTTDSSGIAIYNRVVNTAGTYVYHCEYTHP